MDFDITLGTNAGEIRRQISQAFSGIITDAQAAQSRLAQLQNVPVGPNTNFNQQWVREFDRAVTEIQRRLRIVGQEYERALSVTPRGNAEAFTPPGAGTQLRNQALTESKQEINALRDRLVGLFQQAGADIRQFGPEVRAEAAKLESAIRSLYNDMRRNVVAAAQAQNLRVADIGAGGGLDYRSLLAGFSEANLARAVEVAPRQRPLIDPSPKDPLAAAVDAADPSKRAQRAADKVVETLDQTATSQQRVNQEVQRTAEAGRKVTAAYERVLNEVRRNIDLASGVPLDPRGAVLGPRGAVRDAGGRLGMFVDVNRGTADRPDIHRDFRQFDGPEDERLRLERALAAQATREEAQSVKGLADAARQLTAAMAKMALQVGEAERLLTATGRETNVIRTRGGLVGLSGSNLERGVDITDPVRVRQLEDADLRGREARSRSREADAARNVAAERVAAEQEYARRLLEGSRAIDLRGGVHLDTQLNRLAAVADGRARVLEGNLQAQDVQRVQRALRNLEAAAQREANQIARLQTGGMGGRPPGQPPPGFFEGLVGGFSSRGFGRGANGLQQEFASNIGSTMGSQLRFASSFMAIVQAQRAIRDSASGFVEYRESLTDLEVALGSGEKASDDLKQSLGSLASLVGEGAEAAFASGARGIRAFVDIASDSEERINQVAVSFATAAQELSVIARQSLATSTNELVAIGQAFDIDPTDLSRVNEYIAEAKRLGGDSDQITTGLAQASVAARQIGFDARETAILISAGIAQTAQSGQAVATRLSRVFNQVQGSTGQNLFRGLGIATDQDPADQLRELANIYQDLDERDQRNIASRLSGVANIREFTVLLASLEEGSNAQRVLNQGIAEGGQGAQEYRRRLNDLAGQVRQVTGQAKEMRQGLIEAGAFSGLALGFEALKPALQTVNLLLDTFNLLPAPVRLVVSNLALLVGGLLAVEKVRQTGIATRARESVTQQAAVAEARANTTSTQLLTRVKEAAARANIASAAAIDTETAALARNTAARRGSWAAPIGGARGGAAVVAPLPLPPRTAVPPPPTGVVPVPPGPGVAGQAGNIGRLLLGFGRMVAPIAAVTAGLAALQGGIDAYRRTVAAREGMAGALDSATSARIANISELMAGAVDDLRNEAAEQRARTEGITGTIANAFAGIAGPDFNDRARMLDREARELEQRARDRRELELDRAGQEEGPFGTRLDGLAELTQGIEMMESAGVSATNQLNELARALDESVRAATDPGNGLLLGRFEVDDLSESIAEATDRLIAEAFTRAAGVLPERDRGGAGRSRVTGEVLEYVDSLQEGFGEAFDSLEEVQSRISAFGRQQSSNVFGPLVSGLTRTLGDAPDLEEYLGLRRLRTFLSDDEQRQLFAEQATAAVVGAADSAGRLSTEQFRDIAAVIAEQWASTLDLDTSEMESLIADFFVQQADADNFILTGEAMAAATRQMLSGLDAVRSEARLEGETPLEAIRRQIELVTGRIQGYLDLGEEIPDNLRLTSLQLAEDEAAELDRVAAAERRLAQSRRPQEDVAGRRQVEFEGLTADLVAAERQSDPAAIAEAQAAINDFQRESIRIEAERVAAEIRSAFDPRDAVSAAEEAVRSAAETLDTTDQFDSLGNQTQAYSEALIAYNQALLDLASKQADVAAAAARAEIDPRDTLGNATQDLRDARAKLELTLEGTEEYYRAQRSVAEAQLALATAEADLASASARAELDSRDAVGNAAQDVRDAEAQLRLALPGTVEFFNAQRALQDAMRSLAAAQTAAANALDRLGVDIGDGVGEAASALRIARRELELQLPGTAEYYDALNAIRRAERELAERLIEESRLQEMVQADGSQMGEALANLRAAERLLGLSTPDTIEYYERLLDLRRAQREVADLEAELAATAARARLDPRDTLGRARVDVEAARNALANTVQGTLEYYRALEALNQAQQNLSDTIRRIDAARRSAQAALSGSSIAEATASLRNAQAELRAAEAGTEEYWRALGAVRQAQRALADTMRRAAAARRSAEAAIIGTSVAEAAASLRNAQADLRAAERGTEEYYRALEAVARAQRSLSEAYRAQVNARIMSQAFPTSSLQQAAAQLRVAQLALQAARNGTEEYYRALSDVIRAQVELAQAHVQARNVRRSLGSDLTSSLVNARLRLQELRDLLREMRGLDAPADAINEILLDIRRAENDLQASLFGEMLRRLGDLNEIGLISDAEYISRLEAEKRRLLRIQNRNDQQNMQLIELEKTIQNFNRGMEGQFNLGEIRIPTPFEVRRLIAKMFPGMTSVEEAFGVGSKSDPISVLVNGSIGAVQQLTDHVGRVGSKIEEFGDLVRDVLADLNINIVSALGGVADAVDKALGGGAAEDIEDIDDLLDEVEAVRRQRPDPPPAPGLGGVRGAPRMTEPGDMMQTQPMFTGIGVKVVPISSEPQFAAHGIGGDTTVTEHNTYIQIDGADFTRVKDYLERALSGPRVRTVSTRKA